MSKISKMHSRVINASQKKQGDVEIGPSFDALGLFYKKIKSDMTSVDFKILELLQRQDVTERIGKLPSNKNAELAAAINSYRIENNQFKQRMDANYALHSTMTGKAKTPEETQLVHSCSLEYSTILEYYTNNVVPMTSAISEIIYEEPTPDELNVNVVTDVQAK